MYSWSKGPLYGEATVDVGEIEANAVYQEMHVDGGAVAQAFLYPPTLNLKTNSERYGIQRKRVAYIIRNAPSEKPKRARIRLWHYFAIFLRDSVEVMPVLPIPTA